RARVRPWEWPGVWGPVDGHRGRAVGQPVDGTLRLRSGGQATYQRADCNGQRDTIHRTLLAARAAWAKPRTPRLPWRSVIPSEVISEVSGVSVSTRRPDFVRSRFAPVASPAGLPGPPAAGLGRGGLDTEENGPAARPTSGKPIESGGDPGHAPPG